jgi:transposase InsO family protein
MAQPWPEPDGLEPEHPNGLWGRLGKNKDPEPQAGAQTPAQDLLPELEQDLPDQNHQQGNGHLEEEDPEETSWEDLDSIPFHAGPGQEKESLDEVEDVVSAKPVNDPGQIPLGRNLRIRSKRALAKPEESRSRFFSPEQRLLILDSWQKSGLPAGDFASLIGLSKHTLYLWKTRFQAEGPGGLMDRPMGGPKGSRLPELTKRSILMLKEYHPDWGIERISQMLQRGPGFPASPGAVAKVLHEAGYQATTIPTHPHPDKVRFFERATPNELWQTDIFTFILKRQNRRVYLVAFMDDHSRFLISFGLHASASSALIREVFRAGIQDFGAPKEVLTDNGPQYVTWRGKSAFAKDCEQMGIKQIVATPRHPRTLGKLERFWGTLWRECLQGAIFLDLGDARQRIAWFVDYYNFQRVHQGLNGLIPADRFFSAAPQILDTLKARIAQNALDLARHGRPKEPFYLTGQVGGKAFSLHAQGERVFVVEGQGQRKEIDLIPPQKPAGDPPAPVCRALSFPDDQAKAEGREDGNAREVESRENGDGQEDEEPAPGSSPLDNGLKELGKAGVVKWQAQQGEETKA